MRPKLQNGIGRVLSWVFYCIMGILLLLGVYAVIHWLSFSKPSPPETLHSLSLPMLCSDVPEDGLSVTRAVDVNLNSNSFPTIRDTYTLANSTPQDMELTLYYPRYCEGSLLTNTVVYVDDVLQSKGTYFSDCILTLSRKDLSANSAVRLHDYLSGTELISDKAPFTMQFGADSGMDDSLSLFLIEVSVVLPAESSITLIAQWRDRWSGWTKDTANQYSYTISFIPQACEALPCDEQTIELSNYDGIELTNTTFSFDLAQGQTSSLFAPNAKTETLSYKSKS